MNQLVPQITNLLAQKRRLDALEGDSPVGFLSKKDLKKLKKIKADKITIEIKVK